MEAYDDFRAGKPGVYPGVPDKDYFVLDAVSASYLKSLRRGAQVGEYYRNHPPVPSYAMKLGTAVHTVVLEGESVFLERYLVCSGGKDILKKEREQAEAEGKEPITKATVDKVWAIRDSVLGGNLSGPLLRGAQHKECGMVWYEDNPLDPELSPIRCKSKADAISGDFLVDLKTTSAEDIDKWWNSFYKYGYHIQAAHYLDGANQLTRFNSTEYGSFLFVTVETTPPFICQVFALSTQRNGEGKQTIEAGRDQKKKLLRYHAECMENGFEAPEQELLTGEMPGWSFREMEKLFPWERQQ